MHPTIAITALIFFMIGFLACLIMLTCFQVEPMQARVDQLTATLERLSSELDAMKANEVPYPAFLPGAGVEAGVN